MQRIRFLALTIALAGTALPNLAHAQTGQIGSYNRPKTNNYPAVSPYLNLNSGGGGNAAINYFGIVRPQQETSRNFQMIEQGQFGIDQNMSMQNPQGGQFYPDQATGLNTGHVATFGYYSHYYQFPGQQRGGAGGQGGLNNQGRNMTPNQPFFNGRQMNQQMQQGGGTTQQPANQPVPTNP